MFGAFSTIATFHELGNENAHYNVSKSMELGRAIYSCREVFDRARK